MKGKLRGRPNRLRHGHLLRWRLRWPCSPISAAMSPLVETVLFVFGLVALGYLAGLTGYLKAETGDALSEFAVGVAMPLLLFRTMVGADFHGAAPWALWAAYFSPRGVAWTAGHLVITRIFGRDSQAGVVGGVATAFSNLVLLGIPFMLGVFGQEGFEILSLIIAVHLPTMIDGLDHPVRHFRARGRAAAVHRWRHAPRLSCARSAATR